MLNYCKIANTLKYFQSNKINTNSKKMTKKDIPTEEFTLPIGTIKGLSELSREQFLELMSSKHPAAKDFRRYHKLEFKYRMKSNHSLNEFYRDRFLKE